jgi:uncharacterized protein
MPDQPSSHQQFTSQINKSVSVRPHPQLRIIPLADGFSVAYVPSHSQVVLLNQEASTFMTNMPEEGIVYDVSLDSYIDHLIQSGLLIAPQRTPTNHMTPNTLVVWLHITNRCNLRCHYCYLQKSNATMSLETGRAAIDSIVRMALQYRYAHIAIKYAGGEAPLCIDNIAAIHTYAREQADRFGIQVDGGVLSNGTTLTTQKLETLQRLGLQVMISLDGVGEFHDAQRPATSGMGSSSRVMQAIERAHRVGLKPNVAITVTQHNVAGLPQLVQWLLEHETMFNLQLYREHAPNESNVPSSFQEVRIIEALRQTYAVIAQNPPIWSVLNCLLDHSDLTSPHTHTCGMGHHYLVVGPDGQIAQCQMTIDQPITDLSASDPLAELRAYRGIQNISVEQKEVCQSCEWKYWCGGGCPVTIARHTGRNDQPSPSCNIYRSLYPDVVKLEGLRLLHWFKQRWKT